MSKRRRRRSGPTPPPSTPTTPTPPATKPSKWSALTQLLSKGKKSGIGLGTVALTGTNLAMMLGGEAIGNFIGGGASDVQDWWQGREREMSGQQMTGVARQAAFIDQNHQERLQRAKTENAMRLMRFDPHLYAEISSGRPLPLGAVPIGGQQRTDLLDEVSGKMARGEFGPPPMEGGPLG